MGNSAPVYKEMSSKEVIVYDETAILGHGRNGQSIFLYKGSFTPTVAVKRIPNEKRSKKGETDFSCLRHPCVVKLLHYAQETLYTNYAFELCLGSIAHLFDSQSSLREEIKRGKVLMPFDDRVLYMISIGLSYIHSQGLIHGELRPQNVLISSNASGREATIKLADFGLSIQPLETNIWMAPELLLLASQKNEQNVERKDLRLENDLFSVGCIFFYYLTEGRHPFSVYELSNDIDIIGRITNKLEIDTITSFVTNFQNECIFPKDHFAYNFIRKLLKKRPAARISLRAVSKHINNVMDELVRIASYESADGDGCDRFSRLLQQKVDPNCIYEQYGSTPLLLLCRFYRKNRIPLHSLIKELIDAGACVSWKDKRRRNALHLLYENQKERDTLDILECTELLLNAKIDVNEVDDQRLNALQYINNHLTVSEENGIEEVIKKLFERGIKIEEGGFNELHFLIRNYSGLENLLDYVIQTSLTRNGVARINEKDEEGRTVLHYLGIYYKSDYIIDKLLKIEEIDSESRDQHGKTWMIYKQEQGDWTGFFKSLTSYALVGIVIVFVYKIIHIFPKQSIISLIFLTILLYRT